jgi:hypothetical protein
VWTSEPASSQQLAKLECEAMGGSRRIRGLLARPSSAQYTMSLCMRMLPAACGAAVQRCSGAAVQVRAMRRRHTSRHGGMVLAKAASSQATARAKLRSCLVAAQPPTRQGCPVRHAPGRHRRWLLGIVGAAAGPAIVRSQPVLWAGEPSNRERSEEETESSS